MSKTATKKAALIAFGPATEALQGETAIAREPWEEGRSVKRRGNRLRDCRAQAKGGRKNVLERDYQLKLAMGFPPEHFTRMWSLLRLRTDSDFEEAQLCGECGQSGAALVGDRLLCLRCYSIRGSCCAEFDGDDG